MKVPVFFGFLVVVILQTDARSIGLQNHEMPKALKDIMEKSFSCGLELGPLPNLPSRSEVSQYPYPEDNESFNKVWGCVFKKKGIINENSEINMANLETYLTGIFEMVGKTSSKDLEPVHAMAEECSNVSGNGYGQTAVKIQNCVMLYANERNLRK